MATEAGKKGRGLLPWAVGGAVLAAAVAAFLLTRGGDAAKDGGVDPSAEQYARMHDPAYLKALDGLREEQRELAARLAAARAALDAAKEKGEDSPEYKAAQEKMAAAKDAFQKSRAKAQLVVGERIRRENDDMAAMEAKQESSNRKGE